MRQVCALQNSAQAHARDVGHDPDRHLAVSVFANDVGVDATSIHTEVLAQQVAEARRIQDRPEPITRSLGNPESFNAA